MKVRVDLDWHPVMSEAGPAWRCEALGCVFAAFPAEGIEGWRLTCFNTSIPGSTRPVGEDGELRLTFDKAPVWATKEDCFAAVKKFIRTQSEKLHERGAQA